MNPEDERISFRSGSEMLDETLTQLLTSDQVPKEIVEALVELKTNGNLTSQRILAKLEELRIAHGKNEDK